MTTHGKLCGDSVAVAACPYCDAAKGEPCRGGSGAVHGARLGAAMETDEAFKAELAAFADGQLGLIGVETAGRRR